MLFGRPFVSAMNSLRAASASGVGMKLHVFRRASGPTRYQPCSGPSCLMNGNFMYDHERTSSLTTSRYRWQSTPSTTRFPSLSTARSAPS